MLQHAKNFFMIRNRFSIIQDGQSFRIAISELAEILYCSDRYAKKIVKNLIDLQWIAWESGRGRGNLSSLTFLVSKDTVGLAVAKELSKNDNISGAISFVLEHCLTVKDPFLQWLTEHFGYRIEEEANVDLDVFRFPHSRPILSLDPIKARSRAEFHIIRHVFDTLVKYDEITELIQPHLIHHWNIDNPGTTWTFYLRKGVRFHNKDELTAEDIRYTINRLKENTSPYKKLFKIIKQVKIVKTYIFQIILESPNYLLLDLLSRDICSIVHKDSSDQFPTNLIIGTGPFKLVHGSEKMIALEAFPLYFQGRPFLDRVELHNISQQHFELIQQYQFNITFNILEKIKSWNEVSRIEFGGMHILFNLNKKGIQNQKLFRNALHHLINRSELCQLGGKRFLPSSSFFPTYHCEAYENSFNIEIAKSLLNKCGYNHEPISIYTYEKPYNVEDIRFIEEVFEEIGINISTFIVPVDAFFKKEVIKKADIILYPETFDEHALFNIIQLLQDENSIIYNFITEEMKGWNAQQINLIQSEPNAKKKLKIIEEMMNFFRDEYIILFLYHYKQVAKYDSNLSGLSLTSLGWVDFNKVFI